MYLSHVLSCKFYLNKSGDSVSAVRTWGNFWRVSPTKTRRECIRISVVAHACDLDTWEAEAGGSWVWASAVSSLGSCGEARVFLLVCFQTFIANAKRRAFHMTSLPALTGFWDIDFRNWPLIPELLKTAGRRRQQRESFPGAPWCLLRWEWLDGEQREELASLSCSVLSAVMLSSHACPVKSLALVLCSGEPWIWGVFEENAIVMFPISLRCHQK